MEHRSEEEAPEMAQPAGHRRTYREESPGATRPAGHRVTCGEKSPGATRGHYYIRFDNHEQALRLHSQLDGAGIRSDISPTPRTISVCCGVALRIAEGDIDTVRAFLENNGCVYKDIQWTENAFDSHRDHYC